MSLGRATLGGVVAVVFALAISWLSRAPTSYASSQDSLVRLSWRVPGVMVEECRARTEEELAALAAHMRTPEVCAGMGADYELTVALGGDEVIRDTLRPAGARRDRPVYVFRELEVEPGPHEVDVAFRALVPEAFEAPDRTLELDWEGEVLVEPTEIALITLDESGRTLVARGP